MLLQDATDDYFQVCIDSVYAALKAQVAVSLFIQEDFKTQETGSKIERWLKQIPLLIVDDKTIQP
jgi:hypothetical protein